MSVPIDPQELDLIDDVLAAAYDVSRAVDRAVTTDGNAMHNSIPALNEKLRDALRKLDKWGKERTP